MYLRALKTSSCQVSKGFNNARFLGLFRLALVRHLSQTHFLNNFFSLDNTALE